MDTAAILYSYCQKFAYTILPVTTLIAVISLMMQIYTFVINKSQEGQNHKGINKSQEGQNHLNNQLLERYPKQQDEENQALIDKNDKNQNDVENAIKDSKSDTHKIKNLELDLQNLQQAVNHFKLIIQKQNEKIQNDKNDIVNYNQNIEKLSQCKSIIDQIEDIKISVEIYHDKYEEDLKMFNNNFKALYQNNEENKQKVRGILLQLYEKTTQQRQVDDQFKSYVRAIQDKSELKKNYNLSLQASAELSKHCNEFREVRGDGNCFYSAFGYQFLQILLFHYSFDQFFEFIQKMKQIELPMKIFVEGLDFKIDDKEIEKVLLQEFLSRLIKLKSIQDINLRQESFIKQFAAYQYESDEIDSCFYGLSTLFFRNYSDYIIEKSEIKDAIDDKQNLLIWELECNNNEAIIAELAKSLNVFVQLIFFKKSGEYNINQYGNKGNQKIILLIKPGHYNIGILKEETQSDQLIKKFNMVYQELNTLINQNQDQQQIYQQYIQESASLKKMVRSIQDKFQEGQLPEIEVWKLKEGLQQQQY